jgi:predicted glycogen debranching enzyme
MKIMARRCIVEYEDAMIRFPGEACAGFDAAVRREWLETNGLGGFASSTITGANSRRYHGLLTAATRPPVGRVVMLSKFEETLIAGERRYELSANRYPGAIYPRGHESLKEFRLDPFPTYVYAVGGLEIEKRVFMVHGENTTVVEWELRANNGQPPADVTLEVRPLIAFRDYHSTTRRNDGLDPAVEETPGLAIVRPYADLPALHFAHNAGEIDANGLWYFNFEYDLERERGLDFQEDLYSPFLAIFSLTDGGAYVVASDRRRTADVAGLRAAETARRACVVSSAPAGDPLVAGLTAAADQFLVARGSGQTIVAGYHWFSDWGRDTMIALPGLTLVTGRTDAARGILLEFSRHVDRGMLPNRFPDAGETPEYNTVDATLWYFDAVRAYLRYTGDYDFVERLYYVLASIVDHHVAGTRYGIRVDDDGLLRSGEPGVQLTWMDAKVGDWVVTPRHGKPVEIQALWYNALRIMEDLASRFGAADQSARYAALADRTRESFNAQFWNDSKDCLYDVVDGDMRDGSMRPNQVIAASLPYTMLSPERARRMLEAVRRELFTPLGLRSLSPYDPRYRGRYEGDVWSRDSAYHQGTVWAWLMGPFITAWVKAHGRSEEAREEAGRWLREFSEHLRDAGLGQISEIFDGDAPHTPRGCVAQAWSVAELLRAAVEDVHAISRAGSMIAGA